MSSVPVVLPQIFHVAREALSLSRNHFFWSTPKMVCAGRSLKKFGTSVLPMTIRLHDTLDSFRLATNRPWWVSEVAQGTAIDLAPAAVLAQRGGLEATVRTAVAEPLV